MHEHSTGSERVDALGRRAVEVIICMITRDFSVISNDVTGVSLSLSLSQKSLTHNIGSASALPIIKCFVSVWLSFTTHADQSRSHVCSLPKVDADAELCMTATESEEGLGFLPQRRTPSRHRASDIQKEKRRKFKDLKLLIVEFFFFFGTIKRLYTLQI